MRKYPEYVRLQARRLRQDGQTYEAIGETLGGIPRNTIYRWLNPGYAEANRLNSRKAKQRRTGTCEDCGKETRYSGHAERADSGVSRFCPACAAIRNGEAQKVWTRDRIIAAIQWWATFYGEPPAIADFNPTQAVYMGDYRRATRAEHHIKAGQIPWFVTAVREFGSWNAAITAAGLTPRARHGGGANVLRRRRRAA